MSYTLTNTMITDTVTVDNTFPPYTINTTSGGTGSTTNTSGGLHWGTPGQVLTTNGTSTSWITTDPKLQGSTLHVQGTAEFDGDVKIKGKSLNDSLERIEARLAILRPNEELEAKWENLRGLRKAYMELEAEIIEKEMIWNTLKK